MISLIFGFYVFIACGVFLWCNTDFYYEYLTLILSIFGQKPEHADEYEVIRRSTTDSHYIKFIAFKYPNFLWQLLACPFCIITWLSVIIAVVPWWITLGADMMLLIQYWGQCFFVTTLLYYCLAVPKSIMNRK